MWQLGCVDTQTRLKAASGASKDHLCASSRRWQHSNETETHDEAHYLAAEHAGNQGETPASSAAMVQALARLQGLDRPRISTALVELQHSAGCVPAALNAYAPYTFTGETMGWARLDYQPKQEEAQKRWQEQAAIDEQAARTKLANRIVTVCIDTTVNMIIRPGPKPEERECYEMADELRAIKEQMVATVAEVLRVSHEED